MGVGLNNSKMEKFEKEIFWKDNFEGKALGGIMFRSFDLNKFIKDLELSHDREVVGIQFDGNNLELFVKKEENDVYGS